MSTFRALIAEGSADRYATHLENLAVDALPPGDVLIEIAYSSLNYKDALAVTGRGKINSVNPPRPLRARAWERLAHGGFLTKLDTIATLEPLSKIGDLCQQILDGQIRGRVVIDVNA